MVLKTRLGYYQLSFSKQEELIKDIPARQLVLMACDIARLVLPVWKSKRPGDGRCILAIREAERIVQDCNEVRVQVLKRVSLALLEAGVYKPRRQCVHHHAAGTIGIIAEIASYLGDKNIDCVGNVLLTAVFTLAGKACDIANPTNKLFQGLSLPFNKEALTPDIIRMGQLIYEKGRDKSLLPVFADALEEAGFETDLIRNHFGLSNRIIYEIINLS